MGLMKEASSSGVLAWCPYHSRRQILAVGSTSSDTAQRAIPHLDFMTFDVADPTTTMPIVNGVTSGGQQFRSISWSGGDCSNPDGPFPLGLVAGSLDSCVGVWNPDPIIRGTNSPRSASSPESDSVDSALYRQIFPHQNFWSNCVRFNPHRSRVFGSASNNGHLAVINMERGGKVPDIIEPGGPGTGEYAYTCLSWNAVVPHILSAGTNVGMTDIWDLKCRKRTTVIRDPAGRQGVSAVAWLPLQATQMIIAYDDDRNPSIQFWDLRNTNYPFKELAGHSKGITDLEFSTIDHNLLLTTGKDSHTVCWSTDGPQPLVLSEISTQQWNNQVRWSPHMPGLFATGSTHNHRVTVNSVQPSPHSLGPQSANAGTPPSRYVPKWFKVGIG
eukprot:GHVN01082536.1.p1 GENE.GHVN01082536.1~~GHVN01082536.1.p1  ORF type:complete len:386 (+),score=28.32 GHVN01082536.1:132-1289(+)